MAKIRVYDLAKEMGVENKVILAELEKAGITGKSHSSNLEEDQAKTVRDRMTRKTLREKIKAKPEVVMMSLKPAGTARDVRPAAAPVEDDMPVAPPPAKKVDRAEKAAKVAIKPGRPRPTIMTVTHTHDELVAPPTVEEHPVEGPQEPTPAEPEEVILPEVTIPDSIVPVLEQETIAPEESAVPEEIPPTPAEAPAAVETAPVEPKPERHKPEIIKIEPTLHEPVLPVIVEVPGEETEAITPPPVAKEGQAAKPQQQLQKKPQHKGPKPARPELEVLDGVDRIPTIPSKLINRLQPVVKKKAPSPAEVAEQAKKDGRKWQDFKTIGKKKGQKGKFLQKVEKVEEPGTVARKRAIKVTEGLTVKDFAEKIGQKSGDIIKKLFEMGLMANINQAIDPDAAVLIADSYGIKLDVTPITDEEAFVEEEVDRQEDLRPRPPVVTIMGHVDHGKTSLLDAIRKTNVTGGEAGGITQHIGAYMVRLKDKDLVFLDTPGHEAFTAMRARGAQVTDIVVLVVAAEDGARPQTIEAINHSKAAKVPIIVAINKIDKPEADPDKVKRELADHGLVPEEWGGDTIFVPVSAKKQIGLEQLLEMILLQADVMELKANPNKLGRGTIIEAKLDKGRGPVATVLVSSGTIRPGDAFVTGSHSGRIRMLLNDKGKKEKEAGPAMPVEVIGLSGVPQAGDSFVVMEDEKKARQVAQSRMQKLREAELALNKRVTLDDLFSQIQQGAVKELNIIIKADVQGSAEAVAESLLKLSTDAVKLKVIHASVGAITESDVMLASASNAIIIGFNIRPEPKASSLAESEGVDIRLYNIIYNAIDEVRSAMEGLLEPTFKEKVLGRAEVRQTFSVPKVGVIAGTYVLDGMITRSCAGVRVLRDNVVVFQGKLGSLKRFKDDVKEALAGYECGIGVENFNDIKVGDIIEAYDIEKFAGKL